MKFPAVTFLLLSVSAPLPRIASHHPVTRPVYVFIPSSCLHPELSGQWSRVPASWAPGDNVSRNHINCDRDKIFTAHVSQAQLQDEKIGRAKEGVTVSSCYCTGDRGDGKITTIDTKCKERRKQST